VDREQLAERAADDRGAGAAGEALAGGVETAAAGAGGAGTGAGGGGERVLDESLEEVRERSRLQLGALPRRLRSFPAPDDVEPYPVELSAELAAAALAELGSPGYLGSLFRAPLTAWLLGCAAAFQLAALGLIARIARVER
jgi:hypothetical protein